MYYYPNTAGAGYMQSQSQSIPQQMPQSCLKGRPVSSLEEVRAAQIDFDGSLFIFPDLAHSRIYTKQISMDGNASLNMYELTPIPTEQKMETSNFVTREEFNNVMAQLKDAFAQPKDGKSEPPQFNF